MPTPPNSAVGFVCQRSARGLATSLSLRATARTRNVSRMEAARATPKLKEYCRTRAGPLLGPLVEVDHVAEDLRQRDGRFPADGRVDLAGVGHAARHVLEPLLVRFLVGDERDLGLRVAHLAHLAREIADRDLVVVADVEDLPVGRL